MMDHAPKPPDALLQAIAADLKPVKPAPAPNRLTLRLTPIALLILLLVLLAMGIRRDTVVLGPLLSWGASSLEFALAVLLVWVAAHESSPALRLSRMIVYSAIAVASLVAISVPLLTFLTISANGNLFASTWIMDAFCFAGSTVAGGILIVLFSLGFRKSLAARPVIAGTLYGAAAGIAINAGWRISCPGSGLRHALAAHGGGIVATMLLGTLIGRLLASGPLRTGKPTVNGD